jgi:succinate dehydrogenase / fumarate reductase flavoprotein subunit
MGGLWVDYNLMSNLPGMFVLGEANFSDHGANRLGASALMQGLADGYFVAPYTIGNFLASQKAGGVETTAPEFKQVEADVQAKLKKLMAIKGKRSAASFHRELGQLMWDDCGMARTKKSLEHALTKIPEIREQFWREAGVPGSDQTMNQTLEEAGRVADFLEFGELLVTDALTRNESCGGHFREEYQTAEGEAKRDDENYSHVAAWQSHGVGIAPELHKEPLTWETVHPSERSYK